MPRSFSIDSITHGIEVAVRSARSNPTGRALRMVQREGADLIRELDGLADDLQDFDLDRSAERDVSVEISLARDLAASIVADMRDVLDYDNEPDLYEDDTDRDNSAREFLDNVMENLRDLKGNHLRAIRRALKQ